MDEKLVTLAIHTFQKAQIIKTILESEGIETYLHNVNLIQPVVSSGVRIRIKESDLPAALRIIENSELFLEENAPEEKKNHKKSVLIPIDFSEYSLRACELGFHYAKDISAEVILFHAFFVPSFSNLIIHSEVLPYRTVNGENILNFEKKARKELKEYETFILQKIKSKEWPEVPFRTELRNGLPEEEIIHFAKQEEPELIIMGTRGKNQKDTDLIGSVTAEVLEMSKFPLLTIPEETPFRNLSTIKQIAFGTSFAQKDLIIFDKLFKMNQMSSMEYVFFHISHDRDVWDEIKLAGIKEYFLKQYPNTSIRYRIINADDFVLNLEKFIREESIELITLPSYTRNLFARMFNPSIARKMLFHTNTPLLAIPY
ncbi:universal stress protein [Bacteroidales bacterium OttesenSCG-928-A17]|nr:universal stress protein [Bacteroidales bacterium OttesenSCG-928-A17]